MASKKKKVPFVLPQDYVTEDNVGDTVEVQKAGLGILRFCDQAIIADRDNIWCGVELHDPPPGLPLNDGYVLAAIICALTLSIALDLPHCSLVIG